MYLKLLRKLLIFIIKEYKRIHNIDDHGLGERLLQEFDQSRIHPKVNSTWFIMLPDSNTIEKKKIMFISDKIVTLQNLTLGTDNTHYKISCVSFIEEFTGTL